MTNGGKCGGGRIARQMLKGARRGAGAPNAMMRKGRTIHTSGKAISRPQGNAFRMKLANEV